MVSGRHLVETPENPSDEVAAKLRALAFACVVCGTRIVETETLEAITVRTTWFARATPDPDGSAIVSAIATGLFVTVPHNVVESKDRARSLLPDVPDKIDTYQRDLLCAHCGSYVGYRLETEDGQLQRSAPRRPLKLWYQCGDDSEVCPAITLQLVTAECMHAAKRLGPVLTLVDDAPYHELRHILPPPVPVRPDPPDSLERTARMMKAAANGSKEFVLISSQARDALATVRTHSEQGEKIMRALAQDEADPHRNGLQACNKDAKISPAEHVDGERDSQYISGSEVLGVVLMWALPYGNPVIIVPRFAMKQGATIIHSDAVLDDLELVADEDMNLSKRLLPLAQSSAEPLLRGDVHNAAVEEVRMHVHRVTLGPVCLPAPELPAAAGDAPSFPTTLHHWAALQTVSIPDSDGDDREALLQSAFVGRPARDYFARRGVIGLRRHGCAEPAYLLVRMTPNGLQGLPLPDPGRRGTFGLISLSGRRNGSAWRWRPAAVSFVTRGPKWCDPELYPLTCRLLTTSWTTDCGSSGWSFLPSLHGYVVERVPVLLVPWRSSALAAGIKLCEIKGKDVPKRYLVRSASASPRSVPGRGVRAGQLQDRVIT